MSRSSDRLPITKEIHRLSGEFDRYQRLLELEFKGLTAHEIYELSFSRLLKLSNFHTIGWAPDTGATMIGNDERDRFLPMLRNMGARLRLGANIFDFGCGDGCTLALAIDSFPKDASFGFEDPNRAYLEQYRHLLASKGLRAAPGSPICLGFDETIRAVETVELEGPKPGSQDLCLAMHMLYFVDDIPRALNWMVDRLAPGGALFLTLSDSARSYTGRSTLNYASRSGDPKSAAMRDRQNEESSAFGLETTPGRQDLTAALRKRLERDDIAAGGELQDTRLFGDDLGDLLAFAFLTGLADLTGDASDKVAFVRRFLESEPELLGLAVDLHGPRAGRFSVSEPQAVVVIERC